MRHKNTFWTICLFALAAGVFFLAHKSQANHGGFGMGDCTAGINSPNPSVPYSSNTHTMYAGQTYTARVSCLNTFGETWSQAGGFKIVSISNYNTPSSNIWGLTQVTMTGAENQDKTDNVGSGGTKVFLFNVTAPSTPGTYSFWWQMYDGPYPFMVNPTTVETSITVTAAPVAPTCTSATPDDDWTTATSGTRQTFAYGVANATDVYFPTWSGTTGAEQDDIIWYHLGAGVTNLGGGTYRADINLASHPGLGTISVHVYPYNAAYGFNFCDGATFTRLNSGTINVNSNIPTAWSIICTLTNPSCPTVTSGANITSGSYTTKPYSTWTLVPDTIPGYTYTVTPSTDQTFP